MINLLALTASPAPSGSAPLTFQGALEAASKGISWFFDNLSPAFAWFIPALAVCIGFFVYYWLCLLPRPHSLEWIAMAEEMFPDNIFTRVDVMYSVLGHVWEQQNFKESIRRANAYLEAVADYRAGRYNPVDLLTSAVTHTSTKI